MKQLMVVLFALALAAPLAAQNNSVGLMIGAAEPTNDGFDVDLDNRVLEAFFATELEPGTLFKLKGGSLDAEQVGDATGDTTIEYVDALVEYRFSEVFGSTGLYAGPGFYRQRASGESESNYGLAIGVNGLFPITRRFGILAEVGYHWANFEDSYAFVTATGGLKFSF